MTKINYNNNIIDISINMKVGVYDLDFNGLGDFYMYSKKDHRNEPKKSKTYLNRKNINYPERTKLIFENLNNAIEIALEFNKYRFKKNLGSIYLGKDLNSEKIKRLLIEKGVNRKNIKIINSIKDIPLSLSDIHLEDILDKYKDIEELKKLNNNFDFNTHYIFNINNTKIINFILDVFASFNYTKMINKKCNMEFNDTSVETYIKRGKCGIQIYTECNSENEIKQNKYENSDFNISLFVPKQIKLEEEIIKSFKKDDILIFKDEKFKNNLVNIDEKEHLLFFTDNLNRRLKLSLKNQKYLN